MFKLFAKPKPPKTDIAVDILFHKEANGHVEHGILYADNRMLGLTNEPIRFAFVDVDKAPELTPAIMAHIWDMAERKGYTVHGLRSYTTVVTLMPAPRMSVSTNHHRPRPNGGAAITPRRRPDTDQPRRNANPIAG